MITIPGYNMSLYVTEEDDGIYKQNKALLHDVARVAFDKELSRIKESISKQLESPQIPSLLEDVQEDVVHDNIARNRARKASDKLYGVSMRKEKGKKGVD